MDFPIRNSSNFFACLSLFPWFSRAEQFRLKFFGSLTNEDEILFFGEGKSFITPISLKVLCMQMKL